MTDEIPKAITLEGDNLQKLIENVRRAERQRIHDRLQADADEIERTAESDKDLIFVTASRCNAELIRDEWGGLDDYEPGQRHPDGTTGEQNLEGTPQVPWAIVDGDAGIIPGHGIRLSRSRQHTYKSEWVDLVERGIIERGTEWGPGRIVPAEHSMVIPENVVLTWANEIMAARALRGDLDFHVKRNNLKYAPDLHPGTDAERGQSDNLKGKDDHFRLDASQSSILITTPQCTPRSLNASTHRHQHYVAIRINAPDGRRICEVAMSYDQFARALVSHSDTPCTLDSYWSISPTSVLMRERVRKPVTMKGRMKKRLTDLLTELKDMANKAMTEAQERLDSGKPLTKAQTTDLMEVIERVESRLTGSSNFVIEQALEEAADGFEQVMTQLLVANANVDPGSILRLMPELPAPEPKVLTPLPKPE